jgi:hypothetical protein
VAGRELRQGNPLRVVQVRAFNPYKSNNGAVAICVGIDFGAISSMTRLPDYAARSIV